jgi:hypothetical protein
MVAPVIPSTPPKKPESPWVRRYMVIDGYEWDVVFKAVDEAIHSGWEPLGGLTIRKTNQGEEVYMQTLWLPPKKKTSWWRK